MHPTPGSIAKPEYFMSNGQISVPWILSTKPAAILIKSLPPFLARADTTRLSRRLRSRPGFGLSNAGALNSIFRTSKSLELRSLMTAVAKEDRGDTRTDRATRD